MSIEILINPKPGPKRDWLAFVKTARARQRIRHWIRQAETEQSVKLGQEFLDLTEENWDQNLDVGLKGFFLCSQQAALAMVAQGSGGCIVSTSSVHGRRAWKGDTAYGAAKAGVIRLTESMAVDLGEHGIRCNAVLPGHMDTTHVLGTTAPQGGSIEEELYNSVPLRRRGTPEDIGRAVAFMC